MNTSSQEGEQLTLEVKTVCSRLLGKDAIGLERIGGGRNSQVYKLSCKDSLQYAVKLYFRHSSDRRDRLETEFSSFKFLWENGVRNIPQPLFADREMGCAIYEYISGQKLPSQSITSADIESAVNFLVKLQELKESEGSHLLPPASEAFFSVREIVSNIEQRLNRVIKFSESEFKDRPPYQALAEFLRSELIPAFDKIAKGCQVALNRGPMSYDSEIAKAERTLSPSDFGFHNAIARDKGEIVFLDFEYFGWDDPAKTISDFLLHPGMELGESFRQQFFEQMLQGFKDYRHLAKRVEIVYPLFGLKWCLILLNEFVPQDLLRRGFATANDLDRSEVQLEQLAKAKRMLHKILVNYEQFPYGR